MATLSGYNPSNHQTWFKQCLFLCQVSLFLTQSLPLLDSKARQCPITYRRNQTNLYSSDLNAVARSNGYTFSHSWAVIEPCYCSFKCWYSFSNFTIEHMRLIPKESVLTSETSVIYSFVPTPTIVSFTELNSDSLSLRLTYSTWFNVLPMFCVQCGSGKEMMASGIHTPQLPVLCWTRQRPRGNPPSPCPWALAQLIRWTWRRWYRLILPQSTRGRFGVNRLKKVCFLSIPFFCNSLVIHTYFCSRCVLVEN